MTLKTESELLNNFKIYAEMFKKRFEHKEDGQIKRELESYTDASIFTDIKKIIGSTRDRLGEVTEPIFVAQGKLDDVIDINSAEIIIDEVGSDDKELKYYENSGHVLTIDKEELFEDYYAFLNRNL